MILVFRCCRSDHRYRRRFLSPVFAVKSTDMSLEWLCTTWTFRLIPWLDVSSFYYSFQLDSTQVDRSIDLTLGNFSDAAPLFETDTKQFIGITPYPTTPIATRQMPPLAYPQPKQSSSAFNSNGLTSSSQSSVTTNNNSSSRTYNNNNNNTINNNNNSNTAINNVNNYQQKSSSSSIPQLAPPPQSRANNSNNVNNSSITASNTNTFVRPTDNKPLINGGRSSYTTASQLKHEVNITKKINLFSAFVALSLTSQLLLWFFRESLNLFRVH